MKIHFQYALAVAASLGATSIDLSTAQAAGGAPVIMKVLCRENFGGDKVWRPCAEVVNAPLNPVNSSGELARPQDPPSGMVAQIEQRIEQVIKDNLQADVNNPVCDPSDSATAGSPSCGQPADVSFQVSGFSVKTVIAPKAPPAEGAYLRGAAVMILRTITAQVINELKTQNDFKLSSSETSFSNSLSSAQSQATGAAFLLTSSGGSDTPKNYTQRTNASVELDVENCKRVFNDAQDTKAVGNLSAGDASNRLGSLRQSAQQLCASRANFETMYVQAIVALIQLRATGIFKSAVVADLENIQNALFSQMKQNYSGSSGIAPPAQDPSTMTAAQLTAYMATVTPAKLSSAGSSFTSWYKSNLAPQMAQLLGLLTSQIREGGIAVVQPDGTLRYAARPTIPARPDRSVYLAALSSSAPDASLPFWLMTLGAAPVVGSRRRRRQRAGLPLSRLAATSAILGLILSSACNDNVQAPTPIFSNNDPTIDKTGNNLSSSGIADIAKIDPYGGAGTGNANQAGLLEGLANTKQPNFAGGANPNGTGSGGLQRAATAAGPGGVQQVSNANNPSSNTSSDPGSSVSLPSSASPRGGNRASNTSPGSGGGSGISGGGPSSTAPQDTSVAESKAAESGTSGAATAGGGGGAGAGGGGHAADNGAGLAGFLSGLGGAGGAAGANGSEVGFGGNRELASALGSADPADYFTRIGTRDSLFKIVERRYRKTEMNWASDGSTAAALRLPRGKKLTAEQIQQLTR